MFLDPDGWRCEWSELHGQMKTFERTQDTGALRMAQSVFIVFADEKAVHDEFTLQTAVLAGLGKIATLTIVPCLQCGH